PNYTCDLVRIQTDDIDFQVTPNHRMFIRNSSDTGSKPSDWHFQEAGTLKPNITYEVPSTWQRNHSDSLGTNIDINTIPEPLVSDQQIADGGQSVPISSPGENVPNRIPASDLLTLLALYIRAGATKPAHSPCSVVFDIEDPDEKQTLHRIVNDQLNYNPDTESGLKFSSSWWAQFLEYLCGSKETQLKIPDIVFQGSRKQKQNFLQTLAQEEGDVRQNFWQYKTQSKALRDDLLKLCTELGIKADYESISNGWQIVAKANQRFTFEMDRDGDRCNTDDGVYCVEIADNNTLLAGRNGTFQFVGNSLYGVSGWERFRLYDKEAAAAVTATGREVIKFTETAVNEQGKEVIYGDTDSVMLSLGDDLDKQSAIDQSFTLEDHINDRYDEFALNELNAESHRFEIEFEKLYRRFFQAGKKKRYAGHIVWKEGKDVDDIDITGFEYKRSDIAQITKEVQRNVIEMIVTGEDREHIREYIHDVIENFRAGQVSLEEIAIPGGIGKRLDNYETDTAHVRGAKYANLLLGTNFNRGSKPKRLYLDKVHPSYFREIEAEREEIQNDPLYTEFKRNPDVICFEYEEEIPDEFKIDYEKMLNKTLKGPISRVLEAIDISWEEVKSGQTQTGLGKFTS
ncbi:MAG: DNA polymerase domain-containing protein, partial [Halobacteriaceae archaeon]